MRRNRRQASTSWGHPSCAPASQSNARQSLSQIDSPSVLSTPGKRHAAARCDQRRTADGAKMENITPPGMPARRALAVLDNPPPESPGPPQRVSKKVRAAIDLMVTGQCKRICDAAEKVGLARETLSRALSKPH